MSVARASAVRFVPVCRLDELPVGLGRPFDVGGHGVAVFRTRAGKVFAVAARCPHKGAPLADGMLAGEQVVCPYHAFRYQADTGQCDQAGECAVTTYPVEVAGETVKVGVPA
jgi:nitrite reductase (NADH) small subunit